MGNGPQARLPGRLCSFSDMGRMPHSERAPPSSGTAALRFFPSPASKNPCGKRAKPAKPQPGGHRPRYASTTISSFVSRAVLTSPSIFSSRFFSCFRITFRFGLVTGCLATKIVQQSSKGRIDVS